MSGISERLRALGREAAGGGDSITWQAADTIDELVREADALAIWAEEFCTDRRFNTDCLRAAIRRATGEE